MLKFFKQYLIKSELTNSVEKMSEQLKTKLKEEAIGQFYHIYNTNFFMIWGSIK